MIRAVVFDLDDTLYPERAYAFSGFDAVALEFADVLGEPDRAAALMRRLFDTSDRRRVFNAVLSERGLPEDPALVGRMIETYRSHRPRISLFPDADAALVRFRPGFKTGLITDGLPLQQWAKIEALDLRHRFDEIIVTSELPAAETPDVRGQRPASVGVAIVHTASPRTSPLFGKPHPRAFERMSERLGVAHAECVYVADNPEKDFVAPNQLGWTTVRVQRPDGVYVNARCAAGGEPQRVIHTLNDLAECLGVTGDSAWSPEPDG